MNGTSVGAISAVPWVAGQVESGGRIWTDGHLHGTLFQRSRILLGRRPLNLPRVMKLLRTICCLDVERLRKSPVTIEVTVTSCSTGETQYVDVRTVEDVYHLLTMTAALPLVHGPVHWNGD